MIKSKSVPKGFRHLWKYKGRWDEEKVKPGLWKFRFTATKGKASSKLGNFGVGTKGAWKIRGTQYIEKIGVGKYQTMLVGTKRPMKFYVKKPKK